MKPVQSTWVHPVRVVVGKRALGDAWRRLQSPDSWIGAELGRRIPLREEGRAHRRPNHGGRGPHALVDVPGNNLLRALQMSSRRACSNGVGDLGGRVDEGL